MNEQRRIITLPSGRSAAVRKPKVRDLLQAHRVVGFGGEPMAIAMGLVAEVVLIDNTAVVFEDVLDLPAEDGLILQNAVLDNEEAGNFTVAQEGDTCASLAPQQ